MSLTSGSYLAMFVFLTVLVIMLLVIIICVLKRYRKRYKSSSTFVPSATGVPSCDNAVTTAAARKEKGLSGNYLSNPTYTVTMANVYDTPSEYENTSSAVPQDYEIHNDNIYYWKQSSYLNICCQISVCIPMMYITN